MAMPTLADIAAGSTDQFGALPYVVLGVYLVLLLVLGYAGFRKSHDTEEDYYLAGRGQGWVVSSLTIMATFFSSFALLGAPGMVYKDGVVFALFALNVPLGGCAVFVLGSRIARLGRARGYVTQADMLADYYGSDVALRLLVALVGFLYVVPYVVMQINAGGLLAAAMFPKLKWAFEIGAALLAVITMLYIMVGGMRSVAWTDVVQGLLLIVGMLLAGVATVAALGGLSGFFQRVGELPPTSLSVPGTSGVWNPSKLLTVVVFGSLGSMIQPAQWMRYYAARSTDTLRRSGLIFAVVLTACFLFGVMLVGLGGQALYPIAEAGKYRVAETTRDNAGQEVKQITAMSLDEVALQRRAGHTVDLIPNQGVGDKPDDFDQILIVVLRDHVPAMLGAAGAMAVTLIFVAIMAASMSTADSNLHALSAVLTRDVYDRFIRPDSSPRHRTWVGRIIIAAATVLSIALVIVGHGNPHFKPVAMIAQLGLLAIAFSSQLLPVTLDMLFVRRGSRAGAVAGIITGVAIVCLFTPFFGMIAEGRAAGDRVLDLVAATRPILDLGATGLVGNVLVFAVVSLFTKKPDAQRAEEAARIMRGE
jgi:solute:Na+ symporter, SSS family